MLWINISVEGIEELSKDRIIPQYKIHGKHAISGSHNKGRDETRENETIFHIKQTHIIYNFTCELSNEVHSREVEVSA